MHMVFNVDDGEKECPKCGGTDEIVYFDKDEGPMFKRCYTCDECGCEWSDMKDWSERE